MQIARILILSIFSMTFLLSTTGLRVSQHWCGNALINASVWGDAEPCAHFQSPEAVCPMHKTTSQESTNCCDQREQYVQGSDEDFISSSLNFLMPQFDLVLDFHDYTLNVETVVVPVKKFLNHSPPLLTRPVLLLVQSFLI